MKQNFKNTDNFLGEGDFAGCTTIGQSAKQIMGV
jgi:hypothetical protein